jgi:hypothetical protein
MGAFLVLLSLVIGTGVLIVTTYIYGISSGIFLAMCVASISILGVAAAFFLEARARGRGNKTKAGLLLASD